MTKPEPSLVVIFGEDEYLVSARAREIVDRLAPAEDRALGLEIVDGAAHTVAMAVAAVGECLGALKTMGFFGGRKVVWFRNVSFLADNVVGRSEAVKARVNELAEMIKEGIPAGQILIVSAPKVDKRYAFFKACKAAGEMHEFAVSNRPWESQKQAMTRLREMLSRAGLTMRQDAMDMFLGKVGADTRQMAGEVEKLAVYLGERKNVTGSDVEAVTSASREAPAWDLADAFGRRELSEALRILRQLLFQKESPIGLVMGLDSRVRDLLIYREALNNGWLRAQGSGRFAKASWGPAPPDVETAFSEDFKRDPRKIHPFRIGILAAQARKFSMADLKKCQKAILDTHCKLVSRSISAEILLELLLIKMLA